MAVGIKWKRKNKTKRRRTIYLNVKKEMRKTCGPSVEQRVAARWAQGKLVSFFSFLLSCPNTKARISAAQIEKGGIRQPRKKEGWNIRRLEGRLMEMSANCHRSERPNCKHTTVRCVHREIEAREQLDWPSIQRHSILTRLDNVFQEFGFAHHNKEYEEDGDGAHLFFHDIIPVRRNDNLIHIYVFLL